MSPELANAIAGSWSVPLWATALLLVTALVYWRGWRAARLTRPEELPGWRAVCFFVGLASIWLAIASPLDVLGQWLLLVHMAQHLVLMSVAPPLLLLGAPTVPLLRGLPRSWVRNGLGPLFSSRAAHGIAHFLMHPASGWILMNLAYLGWHVPAAYELALRSPVWHEVEHACFLFTSLLFWWTVIQPWPSHARWSRWAAVPYLIAADLVNTALSAFLAFAGRVVYPAYETAPHLFGLTAMQDQAGAGAFMWVVGSAIYWVPAIGITMSLLSRKKSAHGLVTIGGAAAAGRIAPRGFDLLRMPGVGWLLRARYGRQTLQAVSLTVMIVLVVDAFAGHRMAAMNLAGVLPWNILRALGILALLFAGNLFCMACPFMLPRELARSLHLGRLRWPQWLRAKWIGIALLALFFFGYERFAWWNSPVATAWLLIAYMGAAFVVDSIFAGASFCKYVCPIGQLNFVGSLVSPTVLQVRSQQTCQSCATRDCIRGNTLQRGCELELYLPQKHSSIDCTLCMDCVKACPHDNIGILPRSMTQDLLSERPTSSLGRLAQRPDVAVLAVVMVLAAFANAAAMIAPGADFLAIAGSRVPMLCTAAGSLTAVILVALAGIAVVWLVSRGLCRVCGTREAFGRMGLALVPLGMGMWAAHLLFHLTMTLPVLLPLMQQAACDLGPIALGVPDWSGGGMLQRGNGLLQLQLLCLDMGLLLSLYVALRIAGDGRLSRRLATAALPALLIVTLYALGFWILLQPMQMRGMMMGGM